MHDEEVRVFLRNLLEHPECRIGHPTTREWIGEMKNICLGRPWQEGQLAMATNSLQSIVLRCQHNTPVQRVAIWTNMINLIQLVVKTDRCVCLPPNFAPTRMSTVMLLSLRSMKKSRRLTSGQIYVELVEPMPHAPNRRIFCQWIASGQRYALLAAAGKLHLHFHVAHDALR